MDIKALAQSLRDYKELEDSCVCGTEKDHAEIYAQLILDNLRIPVSSLTDDREDMWPEISTNADLDRGY